MKTIKDWAQTAIDVQNACNLSGVIISFNGFLSWLRTEYPSKDTDWYNQHPISIMFSDKISSLAGTDFSFAYDWCKGVCDGDLESKDDRYNL